MKIALQISNITYIFSSQSAIRWEEIRLLSFKLINIGHFLTHHLLLTSILCQLNSIPVGRGGKTESNIQKIISRKRYFPGAPRYLTRVWKKREPVGIDRLENFNDKASFMDTISFPSPNLSSRVW